MAHGTNIFPKSSGYEVAELLGQSFGVPARYERSTKRVLIEHPRERGGRLWISLYAAKELLAKRQAEGK